MPLPRSSFFGVTLLGFGARVGVWKFRALRFGFSWFQRKKEVGLYGSMDQGWALIRPDVLLRLSFHYNRVVLGVILAVSVL